MDRFKVIEAWHLIFTQGIHGDLGERACGGKAAAALGLKDLDIQKSTESTLPFPKKNMFFFY